MMYACFASAEHVHRNCRHALFGEIFHRRLSHLLQRIYLGSIERTTNRGWRGTIRCYMNCQVYKAPHKQRPVSISLPDDISVKIRPFYDNENIPYGHLSFLSLSPTGSPAPTIRKSDTQLFFSNPHEMLDYVTRRWQDNF